MTTDARQVLDDCRDALAELVDGVQGGTFRRRWIIAIVLLRAVGHVLEKVDSKKSPEYKAAISDWWQHLKPAPPIFQLFIEKERNMILKEYQTNAGQGVSVQLSGIELSLNRQPGETKVDPPNPPIYKYTMNDGPFKGRDPRELIREAIQWWEVELKTIDAAARKRTP